MPSLKKIAVTAAIALGVCVAYNRGIIPGVR